MLAFRSGSALCALVIVSLAPALVSAKKRRPKPSVAILPVTGEVAPRAKVSAGRQIARVVRRRGRPVNVGLLTRRIGRSPAAAASQCAMNAMCLGQVARAAEVELVIAAHLETLDGKVRLTTRVVSVEGTVVHEVIAEGRAGKLTPVLKRRLAGLFSSKPPSPAEAEPAGDLELASLPDAPPPSETEGDLALAQLEPLTPPPADDDLSLEALPDTQPAAGEPGDQDLALVPLEDGPATGDAGDQETGFEDDLQLLAPAASDPSLAIVPPPPPPRIEREGGRGLFIAGIGAVVAGAVGAGAGVYFGLQSQSLRQDIDPNDTILAAQKQLDEAKSAATLANVLLAAGAGAAVVGVGMITVDRVWMTSDSVGGTTSVGVAGRW